MRLLKVICISRGCSQIILFIFRFKSFSCYYLVGTVQYSSMFEYQFHTHLNRKTCTAIHKPLANIFHNNLSYATHIQQLRNYQNELTQRFSVIFQESIPEQGSLKSRDYEPMNNWSPTSERCHPDFNIGYNKASSDSPPFVRINKRLGDCQYYTYLYHKGKSQLAFGSELSIQRKCDNQRLKVHSRN